MIYKSILISVHANCIDNIYADLSWWSSGMIPEKVTWVQFPARINTVCSKILPINNLIFQYLIKHSYISAVRNFLTEYQIMKYVQLCHRSFATSNFFILLRCKISLSSGSSLEAVKPCP